MPLTPDPLPQGKQEVLRRVLASFAATFTERSPVRLVVGAGGRSLEDAAAVVVSHSEGLELDRTAEITVEHEEPVGSSVLRVDLGASPETVSALMISLAHRVSPLVAVTPVQDRANWAQSFRPVAGFAHLFIDNASSDGTADYLRRGGAGVVVRHDEAVDRIANWGRAVREFLSLDQGEWLKWLFAGDTLLPGAADTLLEIIAAAPQVGLIIAEYDIMHADGRRERWRALPETTLLQPREAVELSARRGNWFGSPIGHLLSREAAETVTFGEEPWVADWQACLSIARRFPVLYLAESVGEFHLDSRRHHAAQSQALHSRVQEAELRLRSADVLAGFGVDARADVELEVASWFTCPRADANRRAEDRAPVEPTSTPSGPVVAVHHPRTNTSDRDIHGYAPGFATMAQIAYLPLLATSPELATEVGVVDGRVRSSAGLDLEVVTSVAELQQRADVLVGFEGRPYLEHLVPPSGFSGLKAYHVMDFVFHASAAADALRSGRADLLLGYARHDVHSPFFAHVYRGFEGRVLAVPFGAGPRFHDGPLWRTRRPVAVGLGAVNPVDDPLCEPGELNDYIDFHRGTRWTHAWRRTLSERRDDLTDVLDARFPVWPETKDLTPDAAALLRGAQFFVNDAGLMAFAPARTYEGLASGTVLVAERHAVWGDLGLRHGVNALFHRPDDVDDFRAVVSAARADPDRTASIAAAGSALVEERFRHDAIARFLRRELFERVSTR